MKRKHAVMVLAVYLGMVSSGSAANKSKKEPELTGNTLEIDVGKNILRTWQQVVADNYAYAPKQEYDAGEKKTTIYLPYGNTNGVYHEVRGRFVGPTPGQIGKFHCVDGGTSGLLTYKLHFDKTIRSFGFSLGNMEVGLAEDVLAGVEYSTDGKEWTTLREISGKNVSKDIIGKFVDNVTVEKIKTRDLYIRIYSRGPGDPEKPWGSERWIQFWMAGDPGWGDAEKTFFNAQLKLWVSTNK